MRKVAGRPLWGPGIPAPASPIAFGASGPGMAAPSTAEKVTAPVTTLAATARDLGTLGGRYSEATAIQGSLVVGRSQTTDGTCHAFVYVVPYRLGDVGGSGAPAEVAKHVTATSGTLRFAAGQTHRPDVVTVRGRSPRPGQVTAHERTE